MNFTYEALNGSGIKVAERLEAANEDAAIRRLHDQGLVVLALSAAKNEAGRKQRPAGSVERKVGGGRIKHDAIVAMTRELAIMIGTGVPIAEALALMSENTENRAIKQVIGSVLVDVTEGRSLNDAMAKHPRVFSDLYRSMVASADVGGTLQASLNQAAEYVETTHEMHQKVKGALTYPAVLMMAMVGVVLFMIFFMIPRFADLFKHMGVHTPPTFTIMAAGSKFLRANWWLLPLNVIVTVVGVRKFLSWPPGNFWFTQQVLRIPSVGDLVKKACLARVLRALASLLESGVSMLVALETVSHVAQNVVFEQAIMAAQSRVESGSSLHESVVATRVFPGIVCQMVAVGEKSGRLSGVLMHIARYYEREVDGRLKSLASIIEPVMIVLLGIVVGFIAISIFSPLYSIYDNIK